MRRVHSLTFIARWQRTPLQFWLTQKEWEIDKGMQGDPSSRKGVGTLATHGPEGGKVA